MEISMHKETVGQDVTFVAPHLHMPDAASTMQGVLALAVGYCAQKMNLSNPQAALELLRDGDRASLWYCHYEIARKVAEALGTLDDNIKFVALYEYDATPDDLSFSAQAQSLPIHLIAWTERKTSALNSLIGALDRALAKDYAELIGPRRLAHAIDVQVIDDADVDNRRGVAALWQSIYNQPIRLWEK